MRVVIFILSLNFTLNCFAKINKIIALGPGALRFIVYMQEENKLCGVENIEFKLNTKYRPYWRIIKNRIKKLPVVSEGGPGKMPYFSKIVLLNPDLIITVGFTEGQLNLIRKKTHSNVIQISYGALGRIDNNFILSLKTLGKILGKENRAEELISYINSLKKDLRQRIENVKPKRVYVGGIAYKGIHDFRSTDTDIYYLKLVKAVNIASTSPIKGHIEFSWEKILKINPEYIFIDATSINIVKNNNLKFIKFLNAFKTRKIYKIFPYNYYNTNAELVFISAYYIGKILYPERFKDVNLQKKSKKIFKKFLGKELKINFQFGRIEWN